MVNDDKTFLRVTCDGVLAFGSPWSGKHGLDTNVCLPLKGICFLQRGKENVIRRATPEECLPELRHQSMIPEGAEVIPNRYGTAPGLFIETERGNLFLLPGPPMELEPMFVKQVMPILLEKRKREVHSVLLHVAGVPESEVEERMLPLLSPKLSVAYCASPGLVKLFLSSSDMGFLQECLHDVVFQHYTFPEF